MHVQIKCYGKHNAAYAEGLHALCLGHVEAGRRGVAYLALENEAYECLLVNPMQTFENFQSRKAPPRIAYLNDRVTESVLLN